MHTPIPSSFNIPSQKDFSGTIGVVAFQFDGRGDVTGADKIASVASKILPHAKIEFAIFNPDIDLIEQQLPREEVVRTVARHVTKEKDFLQKIGSMACVILYPTYQDSVIPEELMNEFQKTCVPLIKIRESGAGPGKPEHIKGKTYPLGVDKREYGIILPEENYHHYLASRKETPIARLRHLSSLGIDAQKTILGCPFSEEAIAKFQEQAKLYSGYCRSAQHALDFATTAAQLEFPGEKESSQVIVCILNDQLAFNDFIDRNPEIYRDLQVAAFRNRFGTIEITEGERKRSFSFPPGPKTGTRTLRIILNGLPGPQAGALYKASEKESLATGEQSVWEHLALGKRVAIEFSHVRLEETRSYVALLKQLNPKLGLLFQKSIIGDATFEGIEHRMRNNIPDLTNWELAKHKLLFFKALREDPKMQEGWEQFIKCLNEKHQFGPKLATILKEHIPIIRA